MKIVYSDPKTGRSTVMQLDNDKSVLLLNHKINDVIDATALGMTGYKLKITGGSDTSGFPLNHSIGGSIKTKVLRKISVSGKKKGIYERKTVRGNTISSDTELVNVKIVEYGDKPAAELFPEIKPKEKKAAPEKK